MLTQCIHNEVFKFEHMTLFQLGIYDCVISVAPSVSTGIGLLAQRHDKDE